MGVFDDKRYEELDWISKAVEPLETPLTKVLSELPEEFPVDFVAWKAASMHSYYSDINSEAVLKHLLGVAMPGVRVDHHDFNTLLECFELVINGRAIVDYRNKQLLGDIKLVKLRNTFDEKDLASMLGMKGINNIGNIRYSNPNLGRLNEVMELLGGCESGLRTRSIGKKCQVIRNRLVTLMRNNEWNLKNLELADKVGFWITQYVIDGNLAAFTNFCKLKVMTHKGLPIYSMEETV